MSNENLTNIDNRPLWRLLSAQCGFARPASVPVASISVLQLEARSDSPAPWLFRWLYDYLLTRDLSRHIDAYS